MTSIFDDPTIIPGKVLDQPYAGAVRLAAEGFDAKDIETRRSRILRIPCEIVIVAGVTVDTAAMIGVHSRLVRSGRVPEQSFDAACRHRGVAVAVARVVGCRPLTEADVDASLWWDAAANASEPRWAWLLANLRPLRPFKVRGVPGFCKVDRSMVEAALIRRSA